MPLLAHTVRQAQDAELIESVFVSTDSEEIAAVAGAHGAKVIRRPDDLATDEASSESVMLHALDFVEAEYSQRLSAVVMLQCTSPARRPHDIDCAIEQYFSEKSDSLLSVSPTKHFFWERTDGGVRPLNYDYKNRQRSQDFGPHFVENGSIYVTSTEQLRNSGNRLGGRITLYEMLYWSGFEIDDEDDLALMEWILGRGVF